MLDDTNIIHPNDANRRKRKHVKRAETVRVIRDKEVLQIDEEIPIEKFLGALKKGYARIMTEDQQNEEYKKSVRIARSVSVGNMEAYKDEILAEQEQRRKKRRIKYPNHSRK